MYEYVLLVKLFAADPSKSKVTEIARFEHILQCFDAERDLIRAYQAKDLLGPYATNCVTRPKGPVKPKQPKIES